MKISTNHFVPWVEISVMSEGEGSNEFPKPGMSGAKQA